MAAFFALLYRDATTRLFIGDGRRLWEISRLASVLIFRRALKFIEKTWP
jgi:hypothetical protein